MSSTSARLKPLAKRIVRGVGLERQASRIYRAVKGNAEHAAALNTIISRSMRFDMICEANGIEHRLTKPNHP